MRALFGEPFCLITPLLWLIYFGDLFATYFVIGWLPTLLRADGAGISQAGLATALFPAGGLIGSFALAFTLDRFGVLPVLALLALGAPLFLIIGLGGGWSALILVAILGVGFCAGGANTGIGAVTTVLYPSSIRSAGAGWAQSSARLGAVAAQAAGGVFLAGRVPAHAIFIAPAMALATAAAAALLLAVRCRALFGQWELGEITR